MEWFIIYLIMKSALPGVCGVHRKRFLSSMCSDDPGKEATVGLFSWQRFQKAFPGRLAVWAFAAGLTLE